jgi:hypothetical protein
VLERVQIHRPTQKNLPYLLVQKLWNGRVGDVLKAKEKKKSKENDRPKT